jgi:DNA-binding MarR family transcriptional regulator
MAGDQWSSTFPEELAPAAAALKRLVSTLSADLMDVFFGLNITFPQFRVLHLVRREGRVSGRQLARELGVSPGAVVQLCDRLQEQGSLERVPDTEDRRVTWFQLTETAQGLFEEMLAMRRSRLVPALARLGEQDRRSLTRMLGEVAEVLESERRREPKATGPREPAQVPSGRPASGR